MTGRWIAYLAVLAGCSAVYWAYREWMAWLLLLGVFFLPWLSLLASLPAMLAIRMELRCPAHVEQGERAAGKRHADCPLPCPPCRAGLLAENTLTGGRTRRRTGTEIPTEHCGRIVLTLRRAVVMDYLGLFRLPVFRRAGCTTRVLPRPVPIEPLPDVRRVREMALRPKAGGFAENHELRAYRPGDSPRQIHWKLSAKMDALIYREPMEPVRGLAAVTLELRGSPEELDEKLGRLRFLSQYLLEAQIPHSIYCLTGAGLEEFPVDGGEALERALDAILAAAPAADGEAVCPRAAWQYHIGGDGHGE